MSPSTEKRQRARLARALAEFWAGGEGPTHAEVRDVLDFFGLHYDSGSKRDRVSDAVKSVNSQDFLELICELIGLLRTHSMLSPDNESAAWQSVIDRLQEALVPFGLSLGNDGSLGSSQSFLADAATLPDEPALREHVGRMQRALSDGDSAQLIGSSKELLETASKLVLARASEPEPSKFPALVNKALEVLMLHPKSNPSAHEELAEPVKRILGGVLQVALGMNELRNAKGTGHGRATASGTLGDRHVRLAAGAAVVVATLMLDTLEDPDAPWRRNGSQ